MTRLELSSQLAIMLEITEANGLIVGFNECTQSFHVLPVWEAESKTQIAGLALTNALDWADKDGMGEILVVYGFRPDFIAESDPNQF